MLYSGISTPESGGEEKVVNKAEWSAENPTKSAPEEQIKQDNVSDNNLDSEDKEVGSCSSLIN